MLARIARGVGARSVRLVACAPAAVLLAQARGGAGLLGGENTNSLVSLGTGHVIPVKGQYRIRSRGAPPQPAPSLFPSFAS